MANPIRVVLADDHPLIRAGIRATLTSEWDITIVGEAASGDETVQLCQEKQPDILLLDLSMPGAKPQQLITQLCKECPNTKILILSAFDDDAYIHATLAAGVAGYMLKDEATEAVATAIYTLMQGATWFSTPIMDKVRRWQSGQQSGEGLLSLTARDLQILRHIAKGWDNAQIAEELHLADQTVRNYASRIYAKLGVNSRAEAIVWAVEHGLA